MSTRPRYLASYRKGDDKSPKPLLTDVGESVLANKIADAIVEEIIGGRFTCGELLTAAEIADWLGVSRTPVREAFIILHRKRFLDKDTSRSFTVSSWDKEDLLELAQLRTSLELLAIELVIPRMSPDDLDLLEPIALQMQSAIMRAHQERLLLLDLQFHHSIWRIAGNSLLLQALEDLRAQIRYFMHITRPWEEIDYPSQHRQLIAVLQSGDVETAKNKLREHILSTAMRTISRPDESQAASALVPA